LEQLSPPPIFRIFPSDILIVSDVIKSELVLDLAKGDKKANLNLKADYTKDLSLLNTHLTGTSPLENAKTFDISLNLKKVSSTSGNADLKLAVNENKAEINSKYDFSPNKFLLDATAIINGAKYRNLYKVDKKSNRHYIADGQLVWANNGGGVYDWSVNTDLETLENFQVIVKLNSEKLNLNRLKIELGNRPSKDGQAKKVNFSAQDKTGKLLSGSASYAIKEGDSGYSLEGKGSVSVGSENYPLTYKFAETRLTKNADNEIGREFIVDFDFKKSLYKQHFKLTDKTFKYTQKFCWDGKCSDSELSTLLDIQGLKSKSVSVFRASNEIPKFPVYRIDISNKIERDGLYGSTDTTADILGVVYKVNGYVKKSDAVLSITVPTREIALTAKYTLPDKNQEFATAKIESSLYLDRKGNPGNKATVVGEAVLKNLKKNAIASATLRFSHPSLKREPYLKAEASLDFEKPAAKAQVEVDVLAKSSQKIILSAEAEAAIVEQGRNYTAKAGIISKGLVIDIGSSAHAYASKDGASAGAFVYFVDEKNVKKDAGGLVSATPRKLTALLRVPGHTLVNGEATINLGTDSKSIDGELTLAEGETAVFKATVVGVREVKATLHPKSNPKRSISGIVKLTPDIFEVRAERAIDGKTEQLFFGNIKLDEGNLFNIDYDFSSENIKKSVKYFENLFTDIIDRFRAIVEGVTKEINSELINLAEALKKAQPNYKAIVEEYQKVFKAIREELEKDKNYQKLAEVFKKTFGSLLDALEAQIKAVAASLEVLSKEVTDIQAKFVEVYKKVSPDVIEAYKKLAIVATDVAKEFIKIASKLANNLLEIVREHEKEIKAVLSKVAEQFKGKFLLGSDTWDYEYIGQLLLSTAIRETLILYLSEYCFPVEGHKPHWNSIEIGPH